MSDDARSSLIGILWVFTGIALIALYITAAAADGITHWHVLLTLVILGLAAWTTPRVLRMGTETQYEKPKRNGSLLDDLSDAELRELKRRLDSMDDDDMTANLVGDDGELVWRQESRRQESRRR